MAQRNLPVPASATIESAPVSLSTELASLLESAARLAAFEGVASEAFLHAAWTAYLEARPELREELADKELEAHVRRLRKRGLVAVA